MLPARRAVRVHLSKRMQLEWVTYPRARAVALDIVDRVRVERAVGERRALHLHLPCVRRL